MKRIWFVLLALGLTIALSKAVWAVDVKFSGEYYAAGIYVSKTSLSDNKGQSTAFYFQRLRVKTDFAISPGLTLITRFDALERVWGATRTAAGTALAVDSAGTTAENENIAFDWAYINYKTPRGNFDIGAMNDGSTGTIFGNSYAPAFRIKYANPIDGFSLNLAYTKVKEGSYNAANSAATYADADNDKYSVEGVYQWKSGKAGMQVSYYNYDNERPTSNRARKYYLFTPYAIAKIGLVALQAELNYATGDYYKYDNGTANVDLENMTGWIDATAVFGPIYFGGSIAYASGDDPNTGGKREGGTLNGGRDWSPTLIMYNRDRSYWFGELKSDAVAAGNGFGSSFANGFLYQIRAGVNPTEKLDIMVSFTYAAADEKPANYIDDEYGYELDVTATYKITNNLTYMLGAGYLWTGDYFRGASAANTVQNDYMVINKLMLTF